MTKKIAIIADYGIPAIWNAMKQHIDMIKDAGCSVCVYYDINQSSSIILKEHLYACVSYKNRKDLLHKLLDDETLDYIWCPNIIMTLKIGTNSALRGKLILWVQGTLPDESYLRNRSWIRWIVLYFLEKLAFGWTSKFVFVSNSMQHFYTKRHRLMIKDKESIVVPCLSEFAAFPCENKRLPQSYVYIGGLSAWQCFDETLTIYEKIASPESVFHIITFDTEKAERIVSARFERTRGIKIYSIKERKEIPYVLSKFQYGFLIRQNNPVNYVSSPIKFLEYLSCGVNVITTDAIPSYAKIVKERGIGTVIDLNSNKISINPFSENASRAYHELFSRKEYVLKYQKLLLNHVAQQP